MGSVLFEFIIIGILILSFINCFHKADYNLPLFACYYIVWKIQEVNDSKGRKTKYCSSGLLCSV